MKPFRFAAAPSPGEPLLPRILLLVTALALLAGCAEINKPITPNDTWREKATRSTNGLPY